MAPHSGSRYRFGVSGKVSSIGAGPDSRPLSGRRILVPRPAHQAQQTAGAIRARAAEPLVHPVVEVHDPPDPALLARAMGKLGSYDWIIFTSANGVERSFAEIDRQGLDTRAFGSARVAVIGPKTRSALAARGVRADLVAKQFVAESLVEGLLAQGAPRRALLLRALEAREVLPESLRNAGCEVEVVPAYETRPIAGAAADQLRDRLQQGGADVVLLTSGAIANSFFDALGEGARALLEGVTVASIGPVTSAAIRQRGFAVDVEAVEYTVDGLLDALEAHSSSK
jgi:uroporphyrinogen III methyltransferase/synthase